MSTDIATNQNPMDQFRERVTEKLKRDIGEMLPDDVLQQLTQRAVDEQFFTERRAPNPRGYGSDVFKPPWFVDEVAKVAEPIIRESVQKFIDERTADIEAGVQKFLSDQNLTLLTVGMLTQQMNANMYASVDQIVQAILSR